MSRHIAIEIITYAVIAIVLFGIIRLGVQTVQSVFATAATIG